MSKGSVEFKKSFKQSDSDRRRINAQKKKGPVRSGPRSFMSAGSINYERHKGRHLAEAARQGIHPDLVHLVKHAGKKNPRWLCHICGMQCLDFKDYDKHLFSIQHAEAVENTTEDELIEKNSEEFTRSFLSRLEQSNSSRTNLKILYEEILAATRHVKIEETKWASLRDFCEEKAADGLLRYYFEHGQEYVQIGGTARGFETGFSKKRTAASDESLIIQDDLLVTKRMKLAMENSEATPPIPAAISTELQRDADTKVSFQMKPLQTKAGLKSISSSVSLTSSALSNDPAPTSSPVAITPPTATASGTWVCPGLVVKCLSSSVGDGRYARQKGVVEEVTFRQKLARVLMKDGKVIELPEKKLETVLPALGRQVRVVKTILSAPKILVGDIVLLVALEEEKQCVTVQVQEEDNSISKSDPSSVRRFSNVPFDCICKFETTTTPPLR